MNVTVTGNPSSYNRKIDMVKAIREATGLMFKESKDEMDKLVGVGKIELDVLQDGAESLRRSDLFASVVVNNDSIEGLKTILHAMVNEHDAEGLIAALPLFQHMVNQRRAGIS